MNAICIASGSQTGSPGLALPARLVVLLFCVFVAFPSEIDAAQQDAAFDHFQTGFPLDGAHSTAQCTSCHLHGIFEGTPVSCSGCHSQTSLMSGSKLPENHINTLPLCEECHTLQFWKPLAKMSHDAVVGSCFSCHNGTTATGKTPNHIQSGTSCDDCHTTSAWTPAVFDHSSVSPGTCTTCHNGSTATGKSANHIITAAQCDECHSTIAWLPASFNHDLVTGSCSSCHNGTTATGKPGSHFVTSLQCDECHTTDRWVPIDFRHTSPLYPGDHSGNLQCTVCHQANSELVAWSAPAYVPDCAACHANDFKPSSHKKYENPDTFYNVSELRDCSGSCHMYTDSSMTAIAKNRSGPEHRVTNSDF